MDLFEARGLTSNSSPTGYGGHKADNVPDPPNLVSEFVTKLAVLSNQIASALDRNVTLFPYTAGLIKQACIRP